MLLNSLVYWNNLPLSLQFYICYTCMALKHIWYQGPSQHHKEVVLHHWPPTLSALDIYNRIQNRLNISCRLTLSTLTMHWMQAFHSHLKLNYSNHTNNSELSWWNLVSYRSKMNIWRRLGIPSSSPLKPHLKHLLQDNPDHITKNKLMEINYYYAHLCTTAVAHHIYKSCVLHVYWTVLIKMYWVLSGPGIG